MRFLPFAVLLLAFSCGDSLSQEFHHAFALGDNEFLLDGKPFQIIAGETHFSRIPKEYWRYIS
jgi:beta-galactosidase